MTHDRTHVLDVLREPGREMRGVREVQQATIEYVGGSVAREAEE